MSKTFNKEELNIIAQRVLEEYPEAEQVFATLDGNVFISENRAKLHAGKGRVITFERNAEDSDESKATEVKLSAPERVKLIREATSIEDILAFNNDTAKTVQAAYEAKLQELQKPE